MTTQPGETSSFPQHDQVICSLFEGHYHVGFAVLLNSLLRGGFAGLVWAGYRGELPPWTSTLKQLGPELFQLPNGARLKFEQLTSSIHFTNYKPDFMLKLIERGAATKHLWYFDPDITVRCSWRFYERWVTYGVCLVGDSINGVMPPRHPLRCMWADAAEQSGWGKPTTPQTMYFNGGFIALDIEHASFLERWQSMMQLAAKHVDLSGFMTGNREEAFHASDQDALNLTLMYSSEPVSAIGPEGMGFEVGGFTMYHSVGSAKPWTKKFLKFALNGWPPTNADKHFIDCASGPIQVFSPGELRAKQRAIKAAALLGRFNKRT